MIRNHLAWALLALLTACTSTSGTPSRDELTAWQQQAGRVTIVRDDWGIPHVHGKTDADAVFGLMYAQAEDDFPRIETNFLNAMGRLAEAEGEAALYTDLRMRLFIDPGELQAMYAASPAWLQALMNAWACGLNYYLHSHPEVKPRVLTRFEPWMALSFSEGSIGGDIESVSAAKLALFYGKETIPETAMAEPVYVEPSGSNGIAIAPANTTAGHTLLLINPHTSFYFRAEVQVSSDEGLNAYGAVTWGQFFVYQGFNETAGWMHTSSSVDNIDEYLLTIVEKGSELFYRVGDQERPVQKKRIVVPYRTAAGMVQREFTTYRTPHGPVVRQQDGRWVAVRLKEEPLKALTQSYSRTKARNYAAFRATMELHTNSSNNTIFADREGNIAYLHANFVPQRDLRFDWNRPVDGSDPATQWGPPLAVEKSPFVLNPACGWLYNTNNWPWSAAANDSPKQADYPAYVDSGSENPRGVHAMAVLENKKDFTLDGLVTAAYDSYLPAFAESIPPLVRDFDQLLADDPLRAKLAEAIAIFRGWDYRWSVGSVATSLAVFYGEESGRRARRSSPHPALDALAAACDKLAADFGSWRTPWADINRSQRLTGDIVHAFDDAGPSLPVGFTSARWGSLASFGARAYPQTKKWYGTSGNSFVAVVEFGPKVRARAVSAGGQSGHPSSPHFNDQALRYAAGNLREVYFYREDLQGHIERQYQPGHEGNRAVPK
ncbi:MAG: penicillin acylase family protein [Planctomycetota bacterium]